MLFGNTISMAQKSLDCLWKKQEALSDNIANIDTPGYKRKQVSFEDAFRRRLVAADATKNPAKMREAIEGAGYTVYTRDDSARVDENSVNADVEETEMARTWLHYNYLIQSVTNDIKRYQSVIKTQ